eukprot:CAMPEP_0175779176 /NCGR_PEP_ID=MMETSP0097-20121207/76084_1 /TAXON_ID=311494 /ORGANISM="Alexandrium monilatum, Strain CCMP3105" /LENGTH=50 /DNA_ID=CAMNT_0017089861 /DNA_START=36 /DNA_END=185 /DNA_ORIENTATION=+
MTALSACLSEAFFCFASSFPFASSSAASLMASDACAPWSLKASFTACAIS